MKQRETEVSVGFNEMVKKYQRSREEPTRKRQSPLELVCSMIPFKRAYELGDDATSFKEPRLAGDVKLLCDSMLQGNLLKSAY